MDFLGKWTQRLSEGTKVISQKTDELIEIAEMKLKIKNMESEIEDIKKYIGELVYQYYSNSNTHTKSMPSNEINDRCMEIEGIKSQIAALRKKANFINGNQFCRSCGEITEGGENYCPYCGYKNISDEY